MYFVGVAELAVQDSRGMTPLHLAAWNGHKAIAKLLIEKGAELFVQNRVGDTHTSLLVAAKSGHEAIVKLLQLGVSVVHHMASYVPDR
jgi:ankyrin repeat protein